MSNYINRPQERSADLQRSPFFTVEDWRELFRGLFTGEDRRDDADILARYFLLLREALDQGECELVKTSLKSAIVAAKEFGRFANIELDYYRAYLLGHLKPEDELQFRTTAPISKNGDGAGPIKKNH
jgi:hypothetical protein